jgi:hypothetical protein
VPRSITSSKGPKVKRLRCSVLAGPVRRRWSRWCRSVHRSHAETSVWCPPVHGARAPIEHPNPTSSLFGCRLWTLSPSRTVPEPSSREQPPDSAGRSPAHAVWPAQTLVSEHPPITHRSSTILTRPPRTAEWVRCRPPSSRALSASHTAHRATAAFDAARRHQPRPPPANTTTVHIGY